MANSTPRQMAVADVNSLDDLLDEIQHMSRRDEEQRSPLDPPVEGSDVFLNVYNMMGLNHYLSYIGLGAFHTGVQVHGVEYAYGGHQYSYTGVYSMAPKDEDSVSTHGGVKFKESIHIGFTTMSERQVNELISTLGRQYNGNVYHVFQRNCNHFSNELCTRLCGGSIPPWVNRLAYVTSWMPGVINCLPPSWVTPGNPPAQNKGASSSSSSRTGFLCSTHSLSSTRPAEQPPKTPKDDGGNDEGSN